MHVNPFKHHDSSSCRQGDKTKLQHDRNCCFNRQSKGKAEHLNYHALSAAKDIANKKISNKKRIPAKVIAST